MEMNLFEKDINKQIMRNVEFLISTYKYTCPLFRDFGLAGEFIDKPKIQAETIARVEIEEAIAKYEPRAEIDEIIFEYKDNKIIPKVILKLD